MLHEPALAPQAFRKFFTASSHDGLRPRMREILDSIKKAVDSTDWRVIVAIAKQIYANMGVPKGAIDLRAMVAVGNGWDPVFEGEDVEWAEEAKQFLKVFYKMGNVRGPLFDFKTDLNIDSINLDRQGDFFYLLTASDTGFPMVQGVPNHLIKTPTKVREGVPVDIQVKVPRHLLPEDQVPEVDNGPVLRKLSAAYISNGVAYNYYGRAFAYHVLPDNYDFNAARLESGGQWVHEQYIIHIYDPEWTEQGRGFPAITHAVREFVAMLTSTEFEQITQMILSSISLVETNPLGTTDPHDPTVALRGGGENNAPQDLAQQIEDQGNETSDTPAAAIPNVVIEKIVGGVIRYLKAGTGSKVEPMMTGGPGEMWELFQDRLIRIALTGLNCPPSIIWKANEDNGTSNRVSIERFHRATEDRQSLLGVSAYRKVIYALSYAMKTGRLPYPKSEKIGDWMQWTFSVPPEFIIDDGKIAKSDREDYAAGIKTLTDILGRRSKQVIMHWKQRAEEEAQKQLACIEVNAKYKSKGVEVKPEHLGQPNPSAAPDPATEEDTGSGTGPDKKAPAPKKKAD